MRRSTPSQLSQTNPRGCCCAWRASEVLMCKRFSCSLSVSDHPASRTGNHVRDNAVLPWVLIQGARGQQGLPGGVERGRGRNRYTFISAAQTASRDGRPAKCRQRDWPRFGVQSAAASVVVALISLNGLPWCHGPVDSKGENQTMQRLLLWLRACCPVTRFWHYSQGLASGPA